MKAHSALWTGMLALLAVCDIASPADGPVRIQWQSGVREIAACDSMQAAEAVLQITSRREPRHLVVHFNEPVDSAVRARLGTSGLRLLSYLGDNAFFASVSAKGIEPDALAAVGSLDFATPVESTWKLHPVLAQGVDPTWVSVGSNRQGDNVIGAYVLFHPDVPLAPAGVNAVLRHGGLVRDQIRSVNGLVIEVSLPQIEALAQEDIVQYIEPALPPMDELNSENRSLVGADIVQAPPFGLDGSGVTVLVYDAGRAMNSLGATHPDVTGRITLGDLSVASAHAAHVSCTVGGDGSQSGGVNRGMAPAADLLSYGFESNGTGIFLYTNPGDLEADYTQAITVHGAVLANNSIGTNTCSNGFPCVITGDYGVTSALIDNIVRGSLGSPFRVIWANGNERHCLSCPFEHQAGYHSTAPPACAKNHITVGAVNANDDSMTTFSSWGPTDDGRLKPDICAPGCQVGGDNGVLSCNTSFGLFGYSVLCGTSMAAPTVSGLSALILQDFRVQFPTKPEMRNSTLKILLAHNAVDLGAVGPDFQCGYGSVRVEPTINFMRTGSFFEDEVGQGATFVSIVEVAAGTPQLKVSLAWDDVAGTPNVSPSLVNDLDLRVFDPFGTQFFPWTLDPANPANPAVQTAADHLNNIEQVVINSPTAGIYLVEVLGFNVPQGPQPFSLAASGLLLPGALALTPVSVSLPLGTPYTVTATFRASVAPFDPVPNLLVNFAVIAGPNVSTQGSSLTDMNGEATFSYTGLDMEGTDQIQADVDDAGTIRSSNIATVTWVAGQVVLSPASGADNPGESHTVTATVTQGVTPFDPIVGATVTFDIISGPNLGQMGTGLTDAAGVATFTYTGANISGTDQIQASFFGFSGQRTSNIVTYTWVPMVITLAPATASGVECSSHTVVADVAQGATPFAPIVGASITFDILAGPSAGLTTSVITDATGMATFAYDSSGGFGVDNIQASVVETLATIVSNTVLMSWTASISDCNLNNLADECEIGWDLDCNANGSPDLCDLVVRTDFDPAVLITVGDNPTTIVAGELDGLPGIDLATGNSGVQSVSVLLNHADGTFAAAVDYPLARSAVGLTMADFDSDGDQDLVAVLDDDTVTVLPNNGDGTLGTVSSFDTLGDRATSIASGDLDGQNGPDLVVGNRRADGLGFFFVTVMINGGAGTFPATATYTVADFPRAVVIGDVDGVNGPDIVTAGLQADLVSVLLNNGDGTFAPAANYIGGLGPSSVTLADLDGDLDLDLVVTESDQDKVRIMKNNGSGVFSFFEQVTVGLVPASSVAKDLDNDGDLDLIVANSGTLLIPGSTINVLINKGNGSFAAELPIDTGATFPLSLVVEDFDQNGDPDIAVAHDMVGGNVSVLIGHTTPNDDCNGNAIPDECDDDADGDGVPDDCDICPGTLAGDPVDPTGCPLPIACSFTGTVQFDQTTYPCDGAPLIRVADCDLDTNPAGVETVVVTVASGTGSQALAIERVPW